MANILNIDTVADYLKIRNQEVLHPLVGIVDFENVDDAAKVITGHDALHFNCYAAFLKDAKGCKLKYGGKPYDYDEGTLVFVSPEQTVELKYNDPNFRPKGYALLFHPDLLLGTELDRKIKNYSFFDYSVNEALHLSSKERKVILSLLEKIQFELDQNIDKHSKKLIVANIELFLDYCTRFYDRQFLTRETSNRGCLEEFDLHLKDYLNSDEPKKQGLPSVGFFADKMHLSANYFGDLVKKETGKSAQEHIQNTLIDIAKEKVFDTSKSVSEIAYDLGFKYPQHFTRLFKKRVGQSPSDFRQLN